MTQLHSETAKYEDLVLAIERGVHDGQRDEIQWDSFIF